MGFMLRLILASAVCVGLLSGCATTKELVNKVGSSDTPLAQVLKERPDLRNELATVEIRQSFNTVESPTVAECARGKNTKNFQTAKCA